MDSDEWVSRDRGSEEQNFARCKPPPDKKFTCTAASQLPWHYTKKCAPVQLGTNSEGHMPWCS